MDPQPQVGRRSDRRDHHGRLDAVARLDQQAVTVLVAAVLGIVVGLLTAAYWRQVARWRARRAWWKRYGPEACARRYIRNLERDIEEKHRRRQRALAEQLCPSRLASRLRWYTLR